MKPDKTFDAMGAADASEPPRRSSFPLGTIFLYPEFLAFLTTWKHSGGAAGFKEHITHQLTENVKDAFILLKWIYHPSSTILDIAKILNTKNPQIVTDALSNPHSFFIPLSKIKEVHTGGGYAQGFKEKRGLLDIQFPYIRITTDETSYVIYQNSEWDFWYFTNFPRLVTYFNSKWQTDVVQILEARVMANNL